MTTSPPAGETNPTLADLGEFGLITRVTAGRVQPATTLLGPGDDAAVVAAPDGRVVVCTDSAVEGVHWRPDWSSPQEVGRLVVAANLADVAAMGAVPTALLAALSCPPATDVEQLAGYAEGMWAEAAVVGVGVVGGDVTSAAQVVLTVTALGSLEGRDPVTRAGARPGDVLAVRGRLGWAAAGLAVLSRGFRSPAAVVGAHRVPEPPYAAGPEAARAGATAMVDVSDGLLADAAHLASASRVDVDIDRTALVRTTLEPEGPLQQVASALGGDPMAWVLTGGEDHALLATFPAGAPLPDGWTAIGSVRPARQNPAVYVSGRPAAEVISAVGAEGAGHVHFG